MRHSITCGSNRNPFVVASVSLAMPAYLGQLTARALVRNIDPLFMTSLPSASSERSMWYDCRPLSVKHSIRLRPFAAARHGSYSASISKIDLEVCCGATFRHEAVVLPKSFQERPA